MNRRWGFPLTWGAVSVVAVCALAAAAGEPEPTRDVGLTEHATSRLAQIDVTVSGPPAVIQALSSSDFELRLNDRLVSGLIVDDFCPASPATEAPPTSATERTREDEPPIARSSTVTYLLYFDMAHLTVAGRQDSIDAARTMLPRLLAGGQKAMIVANAAQLKTVVPLTDDLHRLDGALESMVNDITTFDPYAATESRRRAEIIDEMGSGVGEGVGGSPGGPSGGSNRSSVIQRHNSSVQSALRLAGHYAAEERWRQERDLFRLGTVLGRFAGLDPPKIVLYFADTMRQNPGEHYLSFFGSLNLSQAQNGTDSPSPEVEMIRLDSATGALSLDRVINDAAAIGIRFYAIEGQGMTGEPAPIEARLSASNDRAGSAGNQAPQNANSQHTRDAQNTLVSLAAETGGRAFLNGVAPKRMASSILGDLSCMYLLSFDPKGFAQDNPLSVSVKVKRSGVKTVVRGRLVIQSESKRLTGRVLSAFAMPTSRPQTGDSSLRVGLLPISYAGGKFRARVQVSVGGSALPVTKWEIGASLVSRGAVRQDGSGQIEVMAAATPAVFEQDMDFTPGDYDLVAVARESQTDTLLSTEVHGTWPKLDAEPVSIPAIGVSQPVAGGFLRNGMKATQGAVAVAEDRPMRGEVATAVMALVCRAKDEKKSLRVVRTLVGEGETPVGSADLDLSAERCAQIVDMIPGKTLGPGRYRFVVSVRAGDEEVAHAERAMVVPDVASPDGSR